QVAFHKLCVSEEQQSQLKEIYKFQKHFAHEYSETDQEAATAKLVELKLDQVARKDLENRWSVCTSARSGSIQRTLFQCSEDWRRRTPYPFKGCIAHVEVIEKDNGLVTWIAGFFEHNEACQAAFLERCPPIPLHEHVYEVALQQLQSGASITAIQDKNREMIANKCYRDMSTYDLASANVRYLFLPSDHGTLYRKAARNIGVDARELPQHNVDAWLNPDSPQYNPEVSKAVFHYSARAEAGDRFEICISTPEMDEAAYQHAHHSQLVLDGTFGICSSRLLLFIALAVDEDRKGVPIAFLLFSASANARATHASYDSSILVKLLGAWKSRLVCKFGSFEPYSCITDTDTKERNALTTVWPHIILLICKF
ncbi:hypothetical protein C8R42DRAFT_550444, partial [Lentinula raphanica]